MAISANLSIKSECQYAYYGFVTETYGYIVAVLCLGSQINKQYGFKWEAYLHG